MASLEPETRFDEVEKYIDPVYESLKLRAEAAERAVDATKHHLNCMSLRCKIATLELKKAKVEEEKVRLLQRSKFFEAQANDRRKELNNSETLAEQIADEVNMRQSKATHLRRRCATFDQRISRLKVKIKHFEDLAKQEEELKDEEMQKSKQLEIQAMTYEKS